MKILKILYYYYFSYYLKVDSSPHTATLISLSFSQSLLINFIVQMISAYYFCYFLSTWQMFGIGIAFIFFNYFLFIRTGLAKRLVKSPPPLIINQAFTKGFVILFFVITFSFLFLIGIFTKSMFKDCR